MRAILFLRRFFTSGTPSAGNSPDPPPKPRARNGRRVLVVDDEYHIVRLMQINLERAGYKVETAFGGVQALQRLTQNPPNCVVLDAIMPKMDGFAVMAEMQKLPMLRGVKIIVLTALANDQQFPQTYRGEGYVSILTHSNTPLSSFPEDITHVYLGKPFNPAYLVAVVDWLLKEENSSG